MALDDRLFAETEKCSLEALTGTQLKVNMDQHKEHGLNSNADVRVI